MTRGRGPFKLSLREEARLWSSCAAVVLAFTACAVALVSLFWGSVAAVILALLRKLGLY